MAERSVVESCFVEVISTVGKHEITKADESVLAALLMAGAIHSCLEEAGSTGDGTRERGRLRTLLRTLDHLVQRWSSRDEADITDALFAINDGVASSEAPADQSGRPDSGTVRRRPGARGEARRGTPRTRR